MKKINLIVGIILLIGFSLSGLYMNYVIRADHYSDLLMRMQARANHIYILLIGFINILVFFLSDSKFEKSLFTTLNNVFHYGLILAGGFSLLAFWFDHSGGLENRRLTFYAILLSVISLGAFLVSKIVDKRS